MKKILSLVLAGVLMASLALAVSARVYTDKQLVEADIYRAEKAPTVDGKVTDGEYGAPVSSFDQSSRSKYLGYDTEEELPLGLLEDETHLPQGMQYYWTYDDTYIYVAMVVDSENYHNPASLKDGTGGNWWKGHAVKLEVQSAADVASSHMLCFWLPNGKTEADNFYGDVEDGASTNGQHNGTYHDSFGEVAVTREGTITTYEASFEWSKIMPGAPTLQDGDTFIARIQYYIGDATFEEPMVYVYTADVMENDEGALVGRGHELTLAGEKPAAPAAPSTPTTPIAPATFDAGIVAGVIALASAAGVVVSKKRK